MDPRGWRARSGAVRALGRRRIGRLALAGIGLVAVIALTWAAAVASVTSAPETAGGRADAAPEAAGGRAEAPYAPPGPAGVAPGRSAGPASPDVPSTGTFSTGTPAPEQAPATPLVGGPAQSDTADGRGRSRVVPPPGPGDPDVPIDVSGAAQERSVVRTARLELTVTDVAAVAGRVRTIAAGVGGFVASEQSVDRSASFVLRVPAPRLEEVMSQLSGAGKVTTRTEQADDVTDQIADLDGRLQTAKASVARVRALLDKATSVGDVVVIESELTQREAELESLQKRLAAVSSRVAMSTLTVQLTPAPAPEGEQPGGGFRGGLVAGWHALLAVGAAVLTGVGAVLPFLVPLGLLAGLVLTSRRLLRRRRTASSAAASDGG